MDATFQGWGTHMKDSQISGIWNRTDRKLDPYKPFATQSGNFDLTPLGSSAPGPPDYESYGQHNSSFLYQQTRRDPFSLPVTSSS